ncbi:nuclear transport factor 2 family protein [Fontibacter flavus]|uniref:Nuclear transport factor 2 family protein n=1 Tax=Fontibacter flavus TaxID=654838 RepID=A0ABV6FU82_9BACT|nr:nuclear transport factor 2 family protein [Cyclobacteriaceae bacterium]
MYKNLIALLVFFLFGQVKAQKNIEVISEKLAQEQLDAYNNRDIEAFILPYAEDVKVFNFPDQLMYQGRDEMYGLYGRMFSRTPDLHCRLVNRIVMGNTVIDQEEVTINKSEPPVKAIAIYKIKNGKIAEVYFMREE